MPNEFKLIVAGGRDFNNYDQLSNELMELADDPLQLGPYEVSIVSGMARGADALAAHFAYEHDVKLYPMSADWNGPHGKGAGYARNMDMSRFADGLLAFWDGKSRGTRHMIDTMRNAGKFVHVVMYNTPKPIEGTKYVGL
jgi:hypothetical protein